MRARLAVVCLGALGLSSLAGTLGLDRSTAPAVATAGPPPAAAGALAWAPGRRYTYSLHYETQEEVSLAGQPAALTGSLDLDTELVIRGLDAIGGTPAVAVSLAEPRRGSWIALGNPVSLDDLSLDREAVLLVEPDGRLREMRFGAADPPTFRHLVQQIATEMQLVTVAAPRWTIEQVSPHGTGSVHYRWVAGGRLERSRADYQQLKSLRDASVATVRALATAVVAPERHLSTLSAVEDIQASGRLSIHSALTLELQSVAVDDGPEVDLTAKSDVRLPGGHGVNPDGERALLARRAAGLTMPALIDDILLHGAGGTMPDHNRWLWRAVGRLRLEPERCAELVAVFRDPSLNSTARGLVLDLLAAAGHAEAQSALRAALDTPEARADADPASLLQRMAFIPSADGESLDLLAETRATASGRMHTAATLALGSAVSGAGDAGTLHAERLVTDLRATRDPAERALLLRALGNGARTADAAVIADFAHDPDAATRRAVAAALRSMPDEAALGTLRELLGDRDPAVRHEAIETLLERRGDAAVLERLATLTADGTLGPESDARVVTYLSRHGGDSPMARDTLQRLLSRDGQDPRLAARIRALLSG